MLGRRVGASAVVRTAAAKAQFAVVFGDRFEVNR